MITPRQFGPPRPFDLRVRDLAQNGLPASTAKIMAPLFPLGLPGAYIPIGYATAHWLHRRGARGGPAIVSATWLAFVAQRAAKLVTVRERPRRPGIRRRVDSYPSGHTAGVTALAATAAYILGRERAIPRSAAVALGVGAPLLMGAYRVIDDEHWITDVIAGWTLGAAIALLCCTTLRNARGGAVDRLRESASSRTAPRRRVRRARATSGA